MKVEVRVGEGQRSIFLPVVDVRDGWLMVAKAFHATSLSKPGERRRNGASFKEKAEILQWPETSLKVEKGGEGEWEDIRVNPGDCDGRLNYLQRCLVGRIVFLQYPVPESHRVQQWVNSKWRISAGVRILDMQGVTFCLNVHQGKRPGEWTNDHGTRIPPMSSDLGAGGEWVDSSHGENKEGAMEL
ncbi:hypothetical protein F0562_019458 [Nyssa sinensis]|uniref:DUF4283 domain-containing protein n=1 Tax=Nyssa sinensis TaxID=561372 RepID=A0A5J5BPT2_9ASTE|nr:hypothetical protein F0562_019458 [Nyssa sinensis]